MKKEFWSMRTNEIPCKIAKKIKAHSEEIRYIKYENFLLSVYKEIWDTDKLPDEAVVVEYTKFSKEKKQGGRSLTYLLACYENAYPVMSKLLKKYGFVNQGDCPF